MGGCAEMKNFLSTTRGEGEKNPAMESNHS